MKVLRVKLQQEEGWFIAQGLEVRGVITQGRSLEEIVANVREVIELMFNLKNVDIELLVPARVRVPARKRRFRSKRTAKR